MLRFSIAFCPDKTTGSPFIPFFLAIRYVLQNSRRCCIHAYSVDRARDSQQFGHEPQSAVIAAANAASPHTSDFHIPTWRIASLSEFQIIVARSSCVPSMTSRIWTGSGNLNLLSGVSFMNRLNAASTISKSYSSSALKNINDRAGLTVVS